MLLRTSIIRRFKIKPNRKKIKERWQYFNEFRKEKSIGYFKPRYSGDQNPDVWITPEKVRLIAKFHENNYNNTRISNPISKEDKERLGKFHENYQYYKVTVISIKSSWRHFINRIYILITSSLRLSLN